MTPSEEPPIQLIIRMNPPWAFIDEIRRFVESFCACASVGSDRKAQLALAVHELMQNAVPHGRAEEVELDLEVDPLADHVRIRVANAGDDAAFEELQQRVERMEKEPDSLAHYLRAMKEQPTSARGGLGLARVRFEAQLELRVRRPRPGRIVVEAEGPLRAPKLPSAGGTSHA